MRLAAAIIPCKDNPAGWILGKGLRRSEGFFQAILLIGRQFFRLAQTEVTKGLPAMKFQRRELPAGRVSGRVAVIGRLDADHSNQLRVAQTRLDAAFDLAEGLVSAAQRPTRRCCDLDDEFALVILGQEIIADQVDQARPMQLGNGYDRADDHDGGEDDDAAEDA